MFTPVSLMLILVIKLPDFANPVALVACATLALVIEKVTPLVAGASFDRAVATLLRTLSIVPSLLPPRLRKSDAEMLRLELPVPVNAIVLDLALARRLRISLVF